MEACVTEPIPQTPISPGTSTPTATGRWLAYALLATVGMGVLWRLVRYCSGFPIWGDEAMLLLNILERDYLGLTQHLRFAQVAPLLFLWLEKTAMLVLGTSEWAVHLFPFLAGLLSLFFFWRTCRDAFSPRVAGIALAILAVSYYPVRHGAEVKPYAFDLLYSTILAWLTLGHLRNPESRRWLAGLVVIAPIAVFSSYPSVFVGGAVGLVLLPGMRHTTWPQRALYATFGLVLCGSFVAHYSMVAQSQVDVAEAAATRQFLRDYWKDAFPPENGSGWPFWLVRVFTGNMLAYPAGANRGGSTATFLLVLLGAFSLVKNGRAAVLGLCGLPFLMNLVAAILNKYPFGDSARVTLHLAPYICILMAHGIVQAIDWIRLPEWRTRWELCVYAILLACGMFGAVRDFVKPYKTDHDREIRVLVHDLRRQAGADEPVYLCHARDEELVAEFVWYVRTQSWNVDWLRASSIADESKSFWLIQCANQELSDDAVMARLGDRAGAWRISASGQRFVPPENAKMPPIYCHWLHVVPRQSERRLEGEPRGSSSRHSIP